MDFNPCMKHKAVRKAVRKFAETELGPIAHDIDRDSRFPWEVIQKMRPLNYFGLQVPREYGGAELDCVSYAITVEELSRVSAAIGLCVTVHNSVGADPIVRFGTEAQKKRFLPRLASGEHFASQKPTPAPMPARSKRPQPTTMVSTSSMAPRYLLPTAAFAIWHLFLPSSIPKPMVGRPA